MKNLFIIFPLLILINSCKSVKHEEDFPENFNDKLYFQLDEKFVDEIIPKLKDSHLKFLDQEKQSYLSKGLNDPNYLKSIEWDYDSFEINNNDEFLKEQIKSIIALRGKHLKIEKLYLFKLHYSGEQIIEYDFVVIEERIPSVQIYYFYLPNSRTKTEKLPIQKVLYDDHGVTESFVDNLRFSFENIQKMDLSARFSVYKITANGPNKYSVETHIVRDMLSSENYFLEKLYKLKQ